MNELQTAVINLVRDEINLGSAFFEALTGQPASSLRKLWPSGTGTWMKWKGCCDVPPPCWMPQPLGECVSHVSECKSASIDLVVTNMSLEPRNLTITISGMGANLVHVTPASASIPPLDRVTFTLSVDVPQKSPAGTIVDVLVLVQGCRTYYLRWKVSVGTIGLCACHEIEIADGPDLKHNWYDHFYCERRCPNGLG